jgi:hypothetical protein
MCFATAPAFSLERQSALEVTSSAITEHTTEPVRQFIYSGAPDQQVPDDSIFHQFLLKALTGDSDADRNRDGYLTGSELGLHVRERVRLVSKGSQTPHFGKIADARLNRGEFVFVPTFLAPLPAVAALPADW